MATKKHFKVESYVLLPQAFHMMLGGGEGRKVSHRKTEIWELLKIMDLISRTVRELGPS